MQTVMTTADIMEYDFFLNYKSFRLITKDAENVSYDDFEKMSNKELCKRYIGFTVYFYSQELLLQHPSFIMTDEDDKILEAQQSLFYQLQKELEKRQINFDSLLEFSKLLSC